MAATRGDQQFEPDLGAALERLWRKLHADTVDSRDELGDILDQADVALEAEREENFGRGGAARRARRGEP